MIKIKEIETYKNYGRVLSLSNGKIEAYITIDIGPRIIRFGFVDGQNIMQDDRESFGVLSDNVYEKYFGIGKGWENLGGHRIWASPEAYPKTLYPDLDPVKYEIIDNGAIFTPPAEVENGIQKQLVVTMSEHSANMHVNMRIINCSDNNKTYSVWGITVCEKGGKLIIPTNTNDTGRLPNRVMSVWPYTDLSDDRITFTKNYVTITQKTPKDPLKLAFDLNGGSAYYVLGEDVFVKSYKTLHPDAVYPDGGCSFETYTNSDFIEVESLGELKEVKPLEALELCENWSLIKLDNATEITDEESIDLLLKKIK